MNAIAEPRWEYDVEEGSGCIKFFKVIGALTVQSFTIYDAKELIQLGRAIELSKFDFCKKKKCRLDNPACQ